MFYVKSKKAELSRDGKTKIYMNKKVYAVQYKHGYPFFTFYENGQ